MKTRLWVVAGAAAVIVGVTGLSAYADLYQDLVGILPGGSTAPLAPARSAPPTLCPWGTENGAVRQSTIRCYVPGRSDRHERPVRLSC